MAGATTGREAWARLISHFRKQDLDREFDDELAAHIELATEDHLRKGMSLPEARRLAHVEFGGIEVVKEAHRDSRGLPWLDSIVQDLHYAARMMRRSPGFTAVAVLSLALGIGANTAIFTLIESTLLRPISVKHPQGLRLLTWREQWGGWVAPNVGYSSPAFGTIYEQGVAPDGGMMHAEFSPALLREFQAANTGFESLFAFKEIGRVTAVVDGDPEPANCFLVSGDFYRGMEVAPILGRAIAPENDVRTEAGAVAVISYDYWTRRFARSPSVIGKTMIVNTVSLTVIGVNPEYFTGVEPGAHFEIWAPLSLAPSIAGRAWVDDARLWQMPMMGRLKPGVTEARAQSALDGIFQAYVDDNAGMLAGMLKDRAKRPRFLLQSAARGMDYLTQRYRGLLLALLSLAALVLLIACANVANLLLAKSAVRQREISMRLALGASPSRIVRQLLTEGLLLASMAGIAGVIFGYWTRNSIPVLLATPWRPSPFDTAFDPRVLFASLGTTFFAGVLFSLAPVWQSRRGTAGLSKLRLGRLLVALQVALSLLLLAGAGLCVRTFTNLTKTPLGFNPDHVMLFTLDPPPLFFPVDRLGALLTQVRERLDGIPGVQSATFSSYALMAGSFGSTAIKLHATDAAPTPAVANDVAMHLVGPRFLETMGVPIYSGRGIDEHDTPGAPRVAVVSREFARHFFHSENPIGKMFADSSNVPYQIVGVSGDVLDRVRNPIKLGFYAAWVQAPRARPVAFELRFAGNEAGLTPQILQAVRSVDSRLVVTDLRTQTQQISDTLSEERLVASLAAIFGALALILAMIGIYGVMSYAVARRTSEIGIRVALGAKPGRVAWMVLRETLVLAVAGIAVGIPAALSLSRILDHALAPAWADSFVYGLTPNDPPTIASAVLVLTVVGAAAGYFPARRASRVDPAIALRNE